ncbi:MAG: LacI family DNA-binding transcriptional regulator [Thermoclostridium sp.]|nr:LacI family DNA-binding transcriptional regulator [Thermoclostridium sp.]
MKDVAEYAGISIATVSKYINGITIKEENKKRIEQAIQALDFRVNEIARGLKTKKTATVGVLIPSLENVFSTSIVSNVESILLQHGYSTIICDYQHSTTLENQKFDFLLNKSVDGMILVPQGIDESKVMEALEREIPVILIDRSIKGVDCDVVLADNLNAAYDAVELLITKGHRRIGIICGPQNIYTGQERLKGYIRIHEDYELEIDRELIKYGDYEIQSGMMLMNEFLDQENPPTAVFVTNYEMTLGAVMALNNRNIAIPQELSLIGFDNIQLANVVKPRLSIVVQPMQQIGETAAHLLIKRMKGDRSGFPAMFRLKTEIVEGESISVNKP